MTVHHLGVTISDPSGTRQLTLTAPIELGRELGDALLGDALVSRRHLRLEPVEGGVVATDLGSSNGTYLRGQRIEGPVTVGPGDELRLGETAIRIIAPAPAAVLAPVGTPTAAPQPALSIEPAPPPTPSTSPAGPARHPGTEALVTAAVEVRFLPGSHGSRIAKSYAATAGRARRNLAGLGSEPWGTVPVINLIDPYHDGTELVADGSVVDSTRGEAWVIVSPEAPPEDPHRVLALLFGAALPSATELALVLEGYGVHRSGAPDPNEALANGPLPSLADPPAEQRGTLALSFVRFLVEREGDQGLRRLLAAPAGKVDETAREVYGASLVQLEHSWRRKVLAGEPEVKTGEFLRLSLRYLRPYKARQAEIFLYMLLSLAFTAAFPFVTRRLFDTALPSGEFGQVLTLLIALGVAFVVSLLAGVRQAYQSAWVSGAVTRDIRQSIFDRVQILPAAWYSDHPQGDVLSRLFGDVSAVQNGLSQAIGQGIFQLLTLVVSGTIMLTINLWLGLIVLAAAPLVGFVYRRMANGAQERSLAAQESNSALLTLAAESYRANPVVKMFGLADREQRRFAQQSDRRAGWRQWRRTSRASGRRRAS